MDILIKLLKNFTHKRVFILVHVSALYHAKKLKKLGTLFVFPKSANFKTYCKTTFKNRCASGISRDYKLDAAKMFLETLNMFKTSLKHLVEIFISIFL